MSYKMDQGFWIVIQRNWTDEYFWKLEWLSRDNLSRSSFALVTYMTSFYYFWKLEWLSRDNLSRSSFALVTYMTSFYKIRSKITGP